MDYMVSSLNETSFNLSLGATWTFFAIQFPENGAAIIISALETSESTFQMAKLFRNTECQPVMQKGTLAAEHEWSMSEITLTPDPSSEWTSPQSKKHYYMKYTITLYSQNSQVVLSLQSVRDDQVFINVPKGKPVAKYEGVYTVSATVNKREIKWKGHAWGEVKAADSSNPGGNDQCCHH